MAMLHVESKAFRDLCGLRWTARPSRSTILIIWTFVLSARKRNAKIAEVVKSHARSPPKCMPSVLSRFGAPSYVGKTCLGFGGCWIRPWTSMDRSCSLEYLPFIAGFRIFNSIPGSTGSEDVGDIDTPGAL